MWQPKSAVSTPLRWVSALYWKATEPLTWNHMRQERSESARLRAENSAIYKNDSNMSSWPVPNKPGLWFLWTLNAMFTYYVILAFDRGSNSQMTINYRKSLSFEAFHGHTHLLVYSDMLYLTKHWSTQNYFNRAKTMIHYYSLVLNRERAMQTTAIKRIDLAGETSGYCPDGGCGRLEREEDFRAQATAKEWLEPSPLSRDGVFFPGVPTYLALIMYRLRMDCWRTMFVPSLVYAEEWYPSTVSYLTAESARLTSPQSPVV